MTLAEIETRVKTNIRAELAAGALSVADLHDDSIAQWANEEVYNVMLLVRNPKHFPALQAVDQSITFSSGTASLPSDFFWINSGKEPDLTLDWVNLKVATTSPAVTKRYVRLLSLSEFARYDSSNFVLTPDQTNPVGAIGTAVYIKPTTLTTGYLTYITKHQTITSVAGTEFDALCDNILIHRIMARYFKYLEMPDLEAISIKLAEELAGGN